jgi:hypothetical protein
MTDRRQRIRALVLALLARQEDLELLDDNHAVPSGGSLGAGGDPDSWLERNPIVGWCAVTRAWSESP